MGDQTIAEKLLEDIFVSGSVQDADGVHYPLKANIAREEGEFLSGLIRHDLSITRTLEVGCAQGISSLFILNALSDRKNSFHTLVDPHQSGKWKNIGIANLSRAGFTNVDLLEVGSEVALPALIQQREASFDLIFLDGLHTFDQVMVDLFFANKLLRVGGYLVIDDFSWRSVSKAISYFIQYPAYRIVGQSEEKSLLKRIANLFVSLLPWKIWQFLLPLRLANLANRVRFSSMVALQKTSEDDRGGFWAVEF